MRHHPARRAAERATTTITGGTIAAAVVPRIKAAIQTIPLIGGVLGQIVAGVQGVLDLGLRHRSSTS